MTEPRAGMYKDSDGSWHAMGEQHRNAYLEQIGADLVGDAEALRAAVAEADRLEATRDKNGDARAELLGLGETRESAIYHMAVGLLMYRILETKQ